MCGIFGVWNHPGITGSDLKRASALLRHRGPDDEGFLTVAENVHTSYIQISHFFRIKRFELGAGVCLARNSWSAVDNTDPDESVYLSRAHFTTGAVASGFYRLNRRFSTGVVYRPTFYEVNPNSQRLYEHLISLELRYHLPLNAKK